MDFESLYSSTARRLQPSIIRALLKLVQDPAVISLAGGTPDSNLFDLDRYAQLAEQAARGQGRLSLQYGETAGWKPLREQVAAYMAGRGVTVLGSYSPAVAGATRDDFFDDVHVHREVLYRFLREGKIVD